MHPWDYGAVIAVLGAYALYHVQYYAAIITKGSESNSALSTNIKIAISWIQKHKEKPDAPSVTLAIQTLRNTIIVATFVGGSSLSFGLNFALGYGDVVGDQALELQHIIVTICLLCSFLCWACVIRYASHVGYYIGTISYDEEKHNKEKEKEKAKLERKGNEVKETVITTVTVEMVDLEGQQKPQEPYQAANKSDSSSVTVSSKQKRVDAMLNCVNMVALILIFFNMGFRFMFISLPFAFFGMSPIGLVIAGGVLLSFLYFYDYGVSFAIFVHDESDLLKEI